MANLNMLFLTSTKVGDAGLAHLKGLENLKVLSLSRTQVTDKGLDALKEMKGLKSVYLIGAEGQRRRGQEVQGGGPGGRGLWMSRGTGKLVFIRGRRRHSHGARGAGRWPGQLPPSGRPLPSQGRGRGGEGAPRPLVARGPLARPSPAWGETQKRRPAHSPRFRTRLRPGKKTTRGGVEDGVPTRRQREACHEVMDNP